MNVSCGFAHTLVLDKDGLLYSMGNGSFGRLGHGNEENQWQPKLVEALTKEKPPVHVTRIDAGYDHSIIVSMAGNAYTFGCGAEGKLGHGDWEPRHTPSIVEMLRERRVRVNAAFVGKGHTVVQSSYGIYTCGVGDRGQLGQGPDVIQVDIFRYVEMFRDLLVAHVSCGEEHTCILTSKGYLYTCGNGGSGRLGHGNEDDTFTPTLVRYFSDPLQGCRKVVMSVAAATEHTVVLLRNGEVYAWGEGEGGQLGHGDFEDVYSPKRIEAR